jgi:hypothetical protein
MKYNKQFRLVHPDGTMNTDGPGYTTDPSGNITIVKPSVYHPFIPHFLRRRHTKQVVHCDDMAPFTTETFGLHVPES